MAKWTVGELKEELDNYGDHLRVELHLIDIVPGVERFLTDEFVINDTNNSGEIVVIIETA